MGIEALSDISKGGASAFSAGGVVAVPLVAVGALAAGDFVEIYASAGAKCRKADASSLRTAKGFVLAAVGDGAVASVLPLGAINNQLSGLTAGVDYFLSLTAGGVSTVAPNAVGQLYQRLGVAISATELLTTSDLAVAIA